MTIYLGNISYDSTEAEIHELVTGFGQIFDINYPKDRVTGKQRGFAFVTLNDREDGENAIKSLDGSQFGGRILRAREAEAPDRPPKATPLGFRKHGQDLFGPRPTRRP